MNSPSSIIHHPSSAVTIRKPVISQADEAWLNTVAAGGVLVQEKSDGEWAKGGLAVGPHLLNAEKMRCNVGAVRQLEPQAQRYTYVVNDLMICDGQDVRNQPLSVRWAELQRLAGSFPAGVTLCQSSSILHPPSSFFRQIIERGGEGVVVKDWCAPFGEGVVKVKRVQVFYCVVIGLDHGKGSVALGRLEDGRWKMEDGADNNPLSSTIYPLSRPLPCGTLPLRGGKFERVREGSILKVEAFGLTAKGQLREARPDGDAPDSWLVKY
jgi:hypothetical protein